MKDVYTIRGWVMYPFTFEAIAEDEDDAERQAEELGGLEELCYSEEKVLPMSIQKGYAGTPEGEKEPLLDIGRNLNEELYR